VRTPYTASKSRSAGRTCWSISFRHPLRTDASGKPGLKVRRGLGTSEESAADVLVGQMNELLRDERFWAATARPLAEVKFAPIVIEAFYDGIEIPVDGPERLREESIPLPGRDEGYARVLLVGTTGAGKTTLLRHLIGSDHRSDRFPSTSTGRTTTSDTEVVIADGTYRAVVTFLSERAVRSNVHECLGEAVLAAWRDAEPSDICRKLLNHPDQTFRLTYTLGAWDTDDSSDSEDDGWAFRATEEDAPDDEDRSLATNDRRDNQRVLTALVAEVTQLARSAGEHVVEQVGIDWSELRGQDLDAAEAMLMEEAESRDAYADLIDTIVEKVMERFASIPQSELVRTSTGWPTKWEYESEDRKEFLRRVRSYSSNHAPLFGSLLTPLVQGIRVRGPFYPGFATDRPPQMVFIDGQGLGHSADSAASVTTNITRRFEEVDAVLLVDSAQHPMQAAPMTALRAAAVGGHQAKVFIAFTHFDMVKGANMPSVRAKREHVLAAVRNALTRLKTEIGDTAVRGMEQELDTRFFTLGWLDAAANKLPPKVASELTSLVDALQASAHIPEPVPVSPVYDPASLMFAVQAATREFQHRWAARLGLAAADSERKEHWTRIKALNRRIADRTRVEYDTLRPVADLYTRLTEDISRFLETPVAWDGEGNDEDKSRGIDGVRRTVSVAVRGLASARLIDSHIGGWVNAYACTGPGSTFVRAQGIRDIYEAAAPVPGIVLNPRTKEFLDQVRELVHAAIEEGGGRMVYAPIRSNTAVASLSR
jgi:energy-coupling factor transporter ATP-binding protein EcfA2